ncbi:hypothetical protein [Pseudoalteromonas rubra]|nr:hypothetical protein [Pseudoalteromonas rubra]MEC4091901.1 hypothetical protein [Pseudoalteromonas rubra]
MKKHVKTVLILVGLIFLLGGAFTVEEPRGMPSAYPPIQPD